LGILIQQQHMSEFYGLARLACEDSPQLLELHGITVKAGDACPNKRQGIL
jgi:hypothetical protein